MTKLLVKFRVKLENYNYEEYERRFGPVFNRWLPNGIDDALEIKFDDNTKLFLWFERRGKLDNGHVKFSYLPEDQLDHNVIPSQAMLDGGALYGMVEVDNVADNELEAIVNEKSDNGAYVAIGKRLVTKVIYPYVEKLLNILRITYGQYWVRPLEKWDSRESSLGYYCKQLVMNWSIDDGETWGDFIPNKSTVRITGIALGKPKNDYITEEDWRDIGSLLESDYVPSLGARILSQAHRRKDRGEFKYALIEAVTALEIAMEERILHNIQGKKKLVEDIQNFWKLSMPAKLIIVSSLIQDGGLPMQDVEDSIKAIYLRNDVAHEAKPVTIESLTLIETLMSTISKVLIDPSLKFPKMHMYNATIPSPDF